MTHDILSWPHLAKPCPHSPPLLIAVAGDVVRHDISYLCPFCGPVDFTIPPPPYSSPE